MDAVLPDPATPFGARVAQRLREDAVIWLTSVAADGTPQPNPVWFLWDSHTVLVYNQPTARRLVLIGFPLLAPLGERRADHDQGRSVPLGRAFFRVGCDVVDKRGTCQGFAPTVVRSLRSIDKRGVRQDLDGVIERRRDSSYGPKVVDDRVGIV